MLNPPKPTVTPSYFTTLSPKDSTSEAALSLF